MKDGKKIIIAILLIIFVIITLLVFYFSSVTYSGTNNNENNQNGMNNNGNNGIFDGNGTNNSGNDSNNGNSSGNAGNSNNGNGESESNFYLITNYNEFFSIQNAINKQNDFNTSFVVKEIYISKNNNNKYYFINGSLFVNDIGEETVDYTESVNYLLIVDNKNNNYKIEQLDDDIKNLERYAKNYDILNKDISSGNSLVNSSVNTEQIVTTYIEYFKYMLALDTEQAYEMLTNETKDNYVNYNDFYNQAPDIYNKLTSRLFSYSKKEQDNKIVYSAEDNNRNKIKIYENSIMDFKISY